ncbi:MAG: NAD-dependent epimerase/dehydratase family protein [Alteromonadaceae bacterium]|nr:NAD-dependent epimerase/dehydratase family protein [Alteromonadaceae bacterium]
MANMKTVNMENSYHIPEQALKDLTHLATKVNHVFVTGAGGFLGKAICRFLRSVNIKVTGFARGYYPELSDMGVTMLQGDICDAKALIAAMQGCDLVFHVASKAGVWGSKADYYDPNVKGAGNVLQSCKLLGIDRLIYTSTPSVTFAGVDEEGINESQPYAEHFLNYYAESKAIAEQMMLAANGDELSVSSNSSSNKKLKTVALRPHLIWGPEDSHLVNRVLERGAAGRLKLVGKTDKLVDTTYIDNAAYAHILAAIKLSEIKTGETEPVCAGKSYFISNDQPITMANMLNKILACADLPPVKKRVPVSIAYVVGAILEGIYLALGKKQEPILTRFVVRQLSTSHYFNISAAKEELAYTPLFTIDEGMERLRVSLSSKSL